MRRLFQLTCAIILTLGVAAFLAGCRRGASPTTVDETPDTTTTTRSVPTPATDFERKLKFARDRHFTHIWVFTRKDGAVFTKEDTEILHTNAPNVVDWLKVGDEMKQFIAGSNFPIDPPQMALLQKRYKIEDISGK